MRILLTINCGYFCKHVGLLCPCEEEKNYNKFLMKACVTKFHLCNKYDKNRSDENWSSYQKQQLKSEENLSNTESKNMAENKFWNVVGTFLTYKASKASQTCKNIALKENKTIK